MNRFSNRWLWLLGMPVFALIATVVFYSDLWLIRGFPFLKVYMAALVASVVIWTANRQLLIFLRQMFPLIRETGKRIFWQFFLSTILSACLSLLLSYASDRLAYFGSDFDQYDYLYNLIIALFFVYTGDGIYETIFYFDKWKLSLTETEQLKKANLQSQLDSLKNQVSPHFLFNSLNTLSSLIEEDRTLAVKFVNELSRVYRYLLQSNEKPLCTLKEELEFLDSYFFLLKIRYGEGISLEKEIDDTNQIKQIPPLTLQILVENAVKHNVITPSKPLKIYLSANGDGYLTVHNNLQRKTTMVVSNQMGLANIRSKFKLMGQQGIDVEENAAGFYVRLPLIKAI